MAPTETTQRTCTPCPPGHFCPNKQDQKPCPNEHYQDEQGQTSCDPFTTCNFPAGPHAAGEWMKADGTPTVDRDCRPLAVCAWTSTYFKGPPPHTHYEGEWQDTAPTDTSNRHCAALTTCSASEYEAVVPTRTTDRSCLTPNCPRGTYEKSGPQTDGSAQVVCEPLTTCQGDEYASVVETPTSDRVCTDHTAPCDASTHFEFTGAH